METRDWLVALIEPNKFEAQIVLDLLRAAGVQRVRRFADSKEAMATLELYPANIILMEIECGPSDGVEWTKAFRRDRRMANRKAPVFLMSHAVNRALAESCRHAGANAIIGKPISGSALFATIKKVLGSPREFIDAEGYVGPCRRAGIVTSGMGKRRRKADATAAQSSVTMASAIENLAGAAGDILQGRTTKVTPSEAALRVVQMIAMEAGDGPIMRACAAFSLLLASPSIPPEAFKAALAHCVDGLVKLAALPINQSAARDELAESIRQAVGKAAAGKRAA